MTESPLPIVIGYHLGNNLFNNSSLDSRWRCSCFRKLNSGLASPRRGLIWAHEEGLHLLCNILGIGLQGDSHAGFDIAQLLLYLLLSESIVVRSFRYRSLSSKDLFDQLRFVLGCPVFYIVFYSKFGVTLICTGFYWAIPCC